MPPPRHLSLGSFLCTVVTMTTDEATHEGGRGSISMYDPARDRWEEKAEVVPPASSSPSPPNRPRSTITSSQQQQKRHSPSSAVRVLNPSIPCSRNNTTAGTSSRWSLQLASGGVGGGDSPTWAAGFVCLLAALAVKFLFFTTSLGLKIIQLNLILYRYSLPLNRSQMSHN